MLLRTYSTPVLTVKGPLYIVFGLKDKNRISWQGPPMNLFSGRCLCRIESQELSQPKEGWMVGIPKNQKHLAEIKVTLEFDGSRSDRSCPAGLTAWLSFVWPRIDLQSNRRDQVPLAVAAAGLTASPPSVWPSLAAGLTANISPVRPPKPSETQIEELLK